MGRRGLLLGVMAAALALLCLFVQPHAFAADTLTNVKEPPLFTAWPRRTAEGFLWLAENDPLGAFVVEDDPREQQDEFVHIDQEAGQYIYLSEDLAVHIRRFSGVYNRQTVIWYMADIRFAAPNYFRAFSADPARPSRAQDKPALIAIILSLAAIMLSLALLPPVKGMFVALQWVKGMHGFGQTRAAVPG